MAEHAGDVSDVSSSDGGSDRSCEPPESMGFFIEHPPTYEETQRRQQEPISAPQPPPPPSALSMQCNTNSVAAGTNESEGTSKANAKAKAKSKGKSKAKASWQVEIDKDYGKGKRGKHGAQVMIPGMSIHMKGTKEGKHKATWTGKVRQVEYHPFEGAQGPTFEIPDHLKKGDGSVELTPELARFVFGKFISDEMFLHIRTCMNLYAEFRINTVMQEIRSNERVSQTRGRRHQKKKTMKAYMKNWKPATDQEVRSFIALKILMGVVKLPKVKDYWRLGGRINGRSVVRDGNGKPYLTRERFQAMENFLHIVNIDEEGNDAFHVYDSEDDVDDADDEADDEAEASGTLNLSLLRYNIV